MTDAADEEARDHIKELHDNFMATWWSVTNAKSTDILHENWNGLCEAYRDQPELVEYLTRWWRVRESWAHAYLDNVRHFGLL